jgi:gliding motility-associated transport system ATP-binding protein
MISAHHLTKRFGKFTAIEDVSFDVARGEIVGFLGPNGAGKSTTMRILSGVFPPSQGEALVAGYDVVREPLRARAAVGYFPERVSLYFDMTVEGYLQYVARMKGIERSQTRRAVLAAMENSALVPVASRLIGTLSKGFRQRVGIAQALVGAPQVLILDEPTAGLDPEQVADMRELIRSLRGERTVILSTHILSEVEVTCDRVIILHRGRVRAVDTPARLNQTLRRAARVYVEVIGPELEVTTALRRVPGVEEVSCSHDAPGGALALTLSMSKDCDRREALATAITGNGWGLRELRTVSLSLEEIFLTLIAHSESELEHESTDHLPA